MTGKEEQIVGLERPLTYGSHKRTALAALAIACLFLCGGQSTAFAADKGEEKQVKAQFRHLFQTIGETNASNIDLVSGPEAIEMRNGRVPGRRWLATCGTYTFKLTIQDGVDLSIEQLLARLEKLPQPYARAFELVSDDAEDGIAVYKKLDGAAGHGGKQYINIVRGAGPMVIAHGIGYTLEQKAEESDPKILDRWEAAIKADKVSISDYGDMVCHHDLGEFAKVYAACLSAGKESLSKLRKLSPARTLLWEEILNGSDESLKNLWELTLKQLMEVDVNGSVALTKPEPSQVTPTAPEYLNVLPKGANKPKKKKK